jgi:hypothetical protein
MGSLSDLKRSLMSKADDSVPSYLPAGKAATVAGVGSAGAGALLLQSSRRLPERTISARNSAQGAYNFRQAAMANTTGKKATQRAATSLAQSKNSLMHANRLVASASHRQNLLRSRGALMASAGAGLVGYGAYAKKKNRQAGYQS